MSRCIPQGEHYQQRDRLRLFVDYQRKFLDSLVRGGEEEAKQAEIHYEQAEAQSDKDNEETAAAVASKQQLTAEEEAELSRLWKKLVKLYHPDRFANQPDKVETYHKLTAAINRAKARATSRTLREIAEDPHGFILRQGWATLDFSDTCPMSGPCVTHELWMFSKLSRQMRLSACVRRYSCAATVGARNFVCSA